MIRGRARLLILALAAFLPLAARGAWAEGDPRYSAPQKRTLANGLRVVVFPRPGTGLVQVQLRLSAGVSAEPEGASGVAPLTARLLDQGTTSRSAAEFGRDVERLGGSFAAGAQREFATVAAAYLPQDLESGLELLADAVVNPVFDDSRFTAVSNQAARELLQMHLDPGATADEQIWIATLPGVSAARPTAGSLGGLLTSTRETVRGFYRDRYRPNQAVLAIAGDVAADRAFTLAEQAFAHWSGTGAAMPAPPAPPSASEIRIRLVDRPMLPFAEVRLGWRTPGSGSADELDRIAGARLLQNSLARLLKGRGPARLDVAFYELNEAGMLVVGWESPADSATAMVARVRRAVREAMPSASDTALAALRRQMIATYPLRFETLGGLLSQWLNADFSPGDADRALADYPERAGRLTSASVSKALARELDLEHPAIAVVGPASRLQAPLGRLGRVELVRLDQPPAIASLADRDTLQPPTPDDDRLGREWANRAIAAHGGLEKLRSIHSTLVEAEIKIVLPDRTLTGQMRQLRKDPYRMVFLTSFESFETRQVLNGSRAWSLAPTGALQDADSVSLRALRSGFTSDVPHLLLSLADPTAKLASRGSARLNDREVHVLDVTLGGDRRRLYLSPDGAQIMGMDQNEENTRGGRLMARRIYSDLRPVEGVLLPFQEERQLEGRTVMRLKVTRAEVNADISDAEFERPTGTPASPKN